jgi:molybdenum cofactor cytidylyltransferase
MKITRAQPPQHAVIILAAGASARLGAPKQLIDSRLVAGGGESLVRRVARLALATRPLETVVVLGHHASRVALELNDLPLICATCPNPDEGMAASLRAGLSVVATAAQGVLVLVCDQPALDAAHLDALLAAWQPNPTKAVASAYAGITGVPAVLPRRWFKDLRELHGDEGARRLLRRRRKSVIAVANEALARDVDVPGDLQGDL